MTEVTCGDNVKARVKGGLAPEVVELKTATAKVRVLSRSSSESAELSQASNSTCAPEPPTDMVVADISIGCALAG